MDWAERICLAMIVTLSLLIAAIIAVAIIEGGKPNPCRERVSGGKTSRYYDLTGSLRREDGHVYLHCVDGEEQ